MNSQGSLDLVNQVLSRGRDAKSFKEERLGGGSVTRMGPILGYRRGTASSFCIAVFCCVAVVFALHFFCVAVAVSTKNPYEFAGLFGSGESSS